MVKKMISLIGALGAVFGTAFAAAPDTVWTAAQGDGSSAPAYWFTYTYGTGASIDTTLTSDNIKVSNITVNAKNSDGAGYGFGWDQNCDANWKCTDAVVDLSAYTGVCLTYKATAPFSVEFKQSGATNNFETAMTASSVFKKAFIEFAALKNSKSTWNATKQLGVQFAYKNTHATSTQNKNTIEISSIILADECETFAPVVNDEYPTTAEVAEGDTLKVNLDEVFTDKDGDIVSYTIKIVSETEAVKLADDLYNESHVARFVTTPNPKGDAVVKIIATDASEKTASIELELTTVNSENDPVAVNDSYETKEETALEVALKHSVLVNDYDPDGDKFDPEVVDEPANGTLVFNNDGTFTYTPKKDFFGEDVFTYHLIEKPRADDETYEVRTGNAATVTIKVTNVNDPIQVTVLDSTMTVGELEFELYDTLTLKEDFGTVNIKTPLENIAFSDPDKTESSIEPVAKSSGIVNVDYFTLQDDHIIELTSIENANGVAKVNLFAVDGKDTAGVWFYVKVEAQKDAPVAVDDKYNVYQDSLNKVAANKGVLANDKNPDGKSTLKAYLKTDATNGTVKMDSTGAFTYEAGSKLGEDTFTYFIVNAEGDTSEVATVTLTVQYKNQAPKFIADADTIGKRLASLKEDFSTAVKFTKAEILSWFEDDSDTVTKLTFTTRSDDSLLSPSMSSGSLLVKSVKNACGDANVILVATDTKKASTELVIPASIACVNDKPELLKKSDTIYVGTKPVWKDTFNLATLFKDVDGDTLKYEVTAVDKSDESVKWTIEGNKLIISSKDSASLAVGKHVFVSVKASDAETAISTKIGIFAEKAPTTGIAPVIAMPKATWQNAIRANRGAVALFDMQGRVMWKAKLPVSEADVRNAAAQVQGRKILRVNKQTWTIK